MIRSGRWTGRRKLLLAGAILAAIVGAATFAGIQAAEPERHTIHGSYGFDVTDPPTLAGHADNIVLGRALDAVNVTRGGDNGPPQTQFSVKVMRTLKGSAEGTVTVTQLGGRLGNDVWVPAEQSLLKPGRTYLLVTTGHGDELILLAGPIAEQQVNDAAHEADLVADWRKAIANQRIPD